MSRELRTATRIRVGQTRAANGSFQFHRRLRIEQLEERRLLTAGDLDPTFDGDGIVVTPIGTAADLAYDLALQSDGKIIVVGESGPQRMTGDFAVARYNPDGSLDASFSDDGKVTTDIGSATPDVGRNVAVQADGKIVVAGWSYNGSIRNFALVRYNVDGSLDTTFDGDGKLTTTIGGKGSEAYGLAIQTDGKIIVAGFSSEIATNRPQFALARYNIDGSLDTSFDGDGKLITAIGTTADEAYSIAIQGDGKIVAVGRSSQQGNFAFAVVRYNTDGSLDSSFSSDGKLTTLFGEGPDDAWGVALQDDGKIVVAGESYVGTGQAFAVARYNVDGSLDMTFSGDGKLTTTVGSSSQSFSIAIQADGKLVVAGLSSGGDFTLARYNIDGSLDMSFSGDGIATTDFGTYPVVAKAAVLQGDGKIILAGYLNGITYDFALARYVGDAFVVGDYNRDNTVDAADYVLWRKTFNTTGVPAYSGADGNGDGTIDEDDYSIWRANFGNTLPSGAGSGASVEGTSVSNLATTMALDETVAAASDGAALTGPFAASQTNELAVSPGTLAFEWASAADGPTRVESRAIGRGSSVESQEPESWRDDGLVAWLVSRSDYRRVEGGDSVSQVDDFTDHVATDHAFDAIDQTFAALDAGM